MLTTKTRRMAQKGPGASGLEAASIVVKNVWDDRCLSGRSASDAFVVVGGEQLGPRSSITDYGSVKTGLAFLPMAGAIAAGSALAGRTIERTGPFPLLVASAVVVTVGLASLARISPDSSYLRVQLPGFLLAGAGLGLAFVALTTAAVGSAPAADRGVAAAIFNAAQQIGGALSLAVPTAPARSTGYLSHGSSGSVAVMAGG